MTEQPLRGMDLQEKEVKKKIAISISTKFVNKLSCTSSLIINPLFTKKLKYNIMNEKIST